MMTEGRALAGRTSALVLGALAILAGCGTIGDPTGTSSIGASDAGARPDAQGVADAAPPDAQLPCVEGDAQIQDPDTGDCYMLFLSLTTWDDARTACQTLGGHLAVSSSLDENALFSSIAPNVSGSGLEDVWIGATDAAVEGTYLWIDSELFAFTNFRTGEPNNGGSSGTEEDCLVIEGDTGGLWDDRPCTRAYPYMCERE